MDTKSELADFTLSLFDAERQAGKLWKLIGRPRRTLHPLDYAPATPTMLASCLQSRLIRY